MITKRVFPSSLVLSALLTLGACGGTSTVDLEAAATRLSTRVGTAFAALTTSDGLNFTAVPTLFATKYLDGGFSRADLVASLTANSTAVGTNPDLSLFPVAAVTNVRLTGCDSNDICTLTGTLTNSDADTTTVDFSTKVIVIADVVYFYGDQSSTTAI